MTVNNWSIRKLFFSAFVADIAVIVLFLNGEMLLAALVLLVAVPLGVMFWIRFVKRSRSITRSPS